MNFEVPLTLGKNDFEAIQGFHSQRFAHQALGLHAVPTSVTIRHRFDAMGCESSDLTDQISRAVLGISRALWCLSVRTPK